MDTKSREINQNIKNAVQAVFQGRGEKRNIKCSNPKRTIAITALNSFVDNNPSFKNFSRSLYRKTSLYSQVSQSSPGFMVPESHI